MPDPDIAEDLRRWLFRLMVATALLYAVVLIALVLIYRDSVEKRKTLQDETDRTNKALCTFRGDLLEQAQSSEAFLLEHPNGIPGISSNLIQQGITRQRRTIEALSILQCPETGANP